MLRGIRRQPADGQAGPACHLRYRQPRLDACLCSGCQIHRALQIRKMHRQHLHDRACENLPVRHAPHGPGQRDILLLPACPVEQGGPMEPCVLHQQRQRELPVRREARPCRQRRHGLPVERRHGRHIQSHAGQRYLRLLSGIRSFPGDWERRHAAGARQGHHV